MGEATKIRRLPSGRNGRALEQETGLRFSDFLRGFRLSGGSAPAADLSAKEVQKWGLIFDPILEPFWGPLFDPFGPKEARRGHADPKTGLKLTSRKGSQKKDPFWEGDK